MMAEFVIVIEADNKRAAAAYKKGLDDLELIWGQVEAACLPIDEKRRKQKEEEDAEHQEKVRLYDEAMAKYDAWKSDKSLFKGAAPRLPWYPDRLSLFYFEPSAIDQYQSIRAELKRLYTIAEAALGPFRMTEYKVMEMAGWEDGSRIEQIKKDLGI